MPTNPWFMNDDEEYEHREMMQDVKRWPGEVLHLKNPGRIANGDARQFGVLHLSDMLTVMNLDGDIAHRYSSVDEMIADGWVVD